MDKKDYESLEGSVEGIIYRNMENGFTVLELSHEEELITVVGEMADIAEGEELKLMGYYATSLRPVSASGRFLLRRTPSISIWLRVR